MIAIWANLARAGERSPLLLLGGALLGGDYGGDVCRRSRRWACSCSPPAPEPFPLADLSRKPAQFSHGRGARDRLATWTKVAIPTAPAARWALPAVSRFRRVPQ